MNDPTTYYDAKLDSNVSVERRNGFLVRIINSDYNTFSEIIDDDRDFATFTLKMEATDDSDFMIFDDLTLSYAIEEDDENVTILDSYEFTIMSDIKEDENPQHYKEILKLPNPKEMCIVPINEYITKSVIDSVIENVFENYEYLIHKSSFASLTPTYSMFRYGTTSSNISYSWVKFDYSHLHWITYNPDISAEEIADSYGYHLNCSKTVDSNQDTFCVNSEGVLLTSYYENFGDTLTPIVLHFDCTDVIKTGKLTIYNEDGESEDLDIDAMLFKIWYKYNSKNYYLKYTSTNSIISLEDVENGITDSEIAITIPITENADQSRFFSLCRYENGVFHPLSMNGGKLYSISSLADTNYIPTSYGAIIKSCDNDVPSYNITAGSIASFDNVVYYFDKSERKIVAVHETNVDEDENSLGGYLSDETSRDFYYYITDKIYDVVRILTTSVGDIITLDRTSTGKGKIAQFSFSDKSNSWAILSILADGTSEFGDKYISIIDIALINDNEICVLLYDGKNTTLGKINLNGDTFISDTSTNNLLTNIIISDDKIIGFYENSLVVYDSNTFEYIAEYDLNGEIKKYNPETLKYEDSTIKGISTSYEKGYLYVYSENIAYKVTTNGIINDDFGEFAVTIFNELAGDNYNDIYYDKTITDICQSNKYITYVSTNYDIIGYYDRSINEGNILSPSFIEQYNDVIWQGDDLSVSKDESVSYIAYNRLFGRIYDNLNALNSNITSVIGVEIGKEVYNKISMFPISPLDIKDLPYRKDEIRVGINEMHFESSINRCFIMLYECMETIAKRLNLRKSITGIENFELNLFIIENDDIILKNGEYFYERGYEVPVLNFSWSDNIPNRNDRRLSAEFKYVDKDDIEHSSGSLIESNGVPLSYTLELSATPSQFNYIGRYEFAIKEIYSSSVKIKYIPVSWNKKVFIGIDSTGKIFKSDGTVSYCDMLDEDNLQDFLISDEFNETVYININGTNDEFFIAVPKNEWDSRKVKIYHPVYEEFEYIFSNDSKIEVTNFNCGGLDRGSYYILTCPRYDDGPSGLYLDGLTTLGYKIVRLKE